MDLELAHLPAQERYKLLIGLVIPRLIAWVSNRRSRRLPRVPRRAQPVGAP